MMSLLLKMVKITKMASNYDYQNIFSVEATLLLKRAKLDSVRPNALNIKLFKNVTSHSQKNPPTPHHTLSQKVKDPHPLCVTYYVNGPNLSKSWNALRVECVKNLKSEC